MGRLLPCKLTCLSERKIADLSRWKKQIFTEAEMVAQADEPSVADVEKEKETDLIDLQAPFEAKAPRDDKSDSGSNSGDKGVPPAEPESVKGFQVETEESPDQPTSYADAVKVHNREVTIPEELEPSSSSPNTPDQPSQTEQQDEANEDDEESTTLLDKGKSKAQADSPSTPAKSTYTEEGLDQVPSPRRPAATPTRDRPVSFPVLPRSQSHNSDMTSPSTPSRSPSHPNLSESVSNTSSGNGQGQATPEEKGGKTRKRLTSLKKMVRRISDQGTGLVRSNSTGRPGSRSGGLASPSPDAGDGKKRLPLSRGNSSNTAPQPGSGSGDQ